MKKLFEKTDINNMVLNNRLVRSATWERMANDDGTVNNDLIKIYSNLAKNEVGMIITGYAFVTKHEQPNPKMLAVYDDRFITGLQSLTNEVHKYGSKIILQIAYGGSQTSYKPFAREIWGPSAVKHPRSGVTPKEMTQDNIEQLITSFKNAAIRAKMAAFDGVQIHAAHGYLLSQFLTPYFNRRTDKYGGTLQNRMRIICEIYEEIRSAVGKEFSVMIKINCSDFIENGFTFEECKVVCKTLSELGIDAIEVSGGKAPNTTAKDLSLFAEYGAELAEICESPIIVVNKNRDFNALSEILNKTNIKYFSLSRPFICEPDLAKRWNEGNKSVAKCISCNKCFTPNGIKCILQDKNK